MQCYATWRYGRGVTIRGDGWLLISAVHNADIETNPSFDIDYRSTARLSLHHYPSDSIQRHTSYFHEDSSELTDLLGVGNFFNDGDIGYLGAYLAPYASNYDNAVPIPGALWLLGSGLSFLVTIKKGVDSN